MNSIHSIIWTNVFLGLLALGIILAIYLCFKWSNARFEPAACGCNTAGINQREGVSVQSSGHARGNEVRGNPWGASWQGTKLRRQKFLFAFLLLLVVAPSFISAFKIPKFTLPKATKLVPKTKDVPKVREVADISDAKVRTRTMASPKPAMNSNPKRNSKPMGDISRSWDTLFDILKEFKDVSVYIIAGIGSAITFCAWICCVCLTQRPATAHNIAQPAVHYQRGNCNQPITIHLPFVNLQCPNNCHAHG